MSDEELQKLWEKSEIRARLIAFQNRAVSTRKADWISVKDRLPENNTLVLVFRDGYYALSEIFMQDVTEGTPIWSYTGLGGDPSHWRMLPEPPKNA